jgi:hypothetical protein
MLKEIIDLAVLPWMPAKNSCADSFQIIQLEGAVNYVS